MNYARNHEISPSDDDDVLDELLKEVGCEDTPLPIEQTCSGTLADFHTNKTHAAETCNVCASQPKCEAKHSRMSEMIEDNRGACFGKKEPYGFSILEPEKCQRCQYDIHCESATRMVAKLARTATVITFPTTRAEPAPASVATPVAIPMIVHGNMTDAEAIAAVRAASQAICQAGIATNYTPELRTAFLAASLAVNARGIMPAFRPVARARVTNGGKIASDDDKMLANDLRLIDLDWIARHHAQGRSESFAALLNADGTLNNEKSYEWVAQKGGSEKKVDLLILTPHIQAELFMLKSNAMKEATRRLQERKGKQMTAIVAAIERGHGAGRRKEAPEYLWRLYCLCDLNGWEADNWKPAAVIDSAGRLADKGTARQTRRSILWLKKHLG